MAGDTTTITPHPSTEAWLKGLGADEWVLEDVQFADIDVAASRSNQARNNAIAHELVDTYKAALGVGAVFPPLVLALVGKRLVIVDGNHRHAAMLAAGFDHHPAYVVDAPAALRHVLTLSANALNGRGNTPDELRDAVISLRATSNYTFEQIGVMLGMATHAVASICRAVDARARCGNPKAAAKVSDREMEVIGRIPNDVVLDQFVNLYVAGPDIGSNQLQRIVKDVKAHRSEAAQLEAVIAAFDAVTASPRPKEGRRAARTEIHRIRGALGTIMNLTPSTVALQANGTADDLNVAIGRTIQQLKLIQQEL